MQGLGLRGDAFILVHAQGQVTACIGAPASCARHICHACRICTHCMPTGPHRSCARGRMLSAHTLIRQTRGSKPGKSRRILELVSPAGRAAATSGYPQCRARRRYRPISRPPLDPHPHGLWRPAAGPPRGSPPPAWRGTRGQVLITSPVHSLLCMQECRRRPPWHNQDHFCTGRHLLEDRCELSNQQDFCICPHLRTHSPVATVRRLLQVQSKRICCGLSMWALGPRLPQPCRAITTVVYLSSREPVAAMSDFSSQSSSNSMRELGTTEPSNVLNTPNTCRRHISVSKCNQAETKWHPTSPAACCTRRIPAQASSRA